MEKERKIIYGSEEEDGRFFRLPWNVQTGKRDQKQPLSSSFAQRRRQKRNEKETASTMNEIDALETVRINLHVPVFCVSLIPSQVFNDRLETERERGIGGKFTVPFVRFYVCTVNVPLCQKRPWVNPSGEWKNFAIIL